MYQPIVNRIREAIAAHILKAYGLDVKISTELPPRLEMGEAATPVCFELAKKLKKAPRALAQEIVASIGPIVGVSRIEVAGGGYLNVFLDRGAFVAGVSQHAGREHQSAAAGSPKTIVEHTSINPNKAAHIGHLRNAVLGDTFVRILRYAGQRVEVQNYIDNTGVQVADVVLGFLHLERKSLDDVRDLAAQPKFDYLCWDLYTRVTQFLAEDKKHLELRGETLKKIEEGDSVEAEMGESIATAIVRCHLHTMDRLGIDYDLLPRESEILHLKFWDAAFVMLKDRGAIRYVTSGKNAGCWVMPLAQGDGAKPLAPPSDATADAEQPEDPDADSKIIVRSNGTVTYVAKDIAYHLWKFGLLGRDFHYRPFYRHPDGHEVWMTSMTADVTVAPKFGKASRVFNVIDTRQAYPQQVVAMGLRAAGYAIQADNLAHLSYDVVALTPRCAEQLGYEIAPEDAKKPYVDISGRKGQGVKADDLLDKLIAATRAEVNQRHPETSGPQREENARRVAIGALRYFLLKYTRTTIIAFDFRDALSFEGDTGPYCLYAIVRARSIWKKEAEISPDWKDLAGDAAKLMEFIGGDAAKFLAAPDGNDLWDMVLKAGSLGTAVEASINAQEPAFLAKYAFQLAQAFNLFYHKHHILSEEDPRKKAFLLLLTLLVERQLVEALRLLGIEAPEEM